MARRETGSSARRRQWRRAARHRGLRRRWSLAGACKHERRLRKRRARHPKVLALTRRGIPRSTSASWQTSMATARRTWVTATTAFGPRFRMVPGSPIPRWCCRTLDAAGLWTFSYLIEFCPDRILPTALWIRRALNQQNKQLHFSDTTGWITERPPSGATTRGRKALEMGGPL